MHEAGIRHRDLDGEEKNNMVALTSENVLKAPATSDTVTIKAGPNHCEVIFNDESKIDGRAPGKVYVLDIALAQHYVETTKVARYVDSASARAKDPTKPGDPNDRSMKSTPRGKRG